jgi:hypothetical protein
MRKRRRSRKLRWPARFAIAILAVGLYLFAALIGGLIPVNSGWQEPEQGVTIYIANNGVHADLVLPARAQGSTGGRWCQDRISGMCPPMPVDRLRRRSNESIWRRRRGAI